MHLINTSTLKLEEFLDSEAVQYVILSHTWGKNEISLHQFQDGMLNDKIRSCCTQARKDGYQYAWVDTCCIDKTSSAELSEAINSMYRWYKGADICYVYLEDFTGMAGDMELDLKSCRWFTRGWTLQELIAPRAVEFYDHNWTEIGTKRNLKKALSNITGIPPGALTGFRKLRYYNVAERMSWASSRYTTRKEDEAYSLLGLFNVHMPLLYGEGSNAFRRLQEEILKIKEDYSIFAWLGSDTDILNSGTLFAWSPAAFRKDSHTTSLLNNAYSSLTNLSSETFPYNNQDGDYMSRSIGSRPPPPEITSRGIRMTLPLRLTKGNMQDDFYLALICEIKSDVRLEHREGWKFFCLRLHRLDSDRHYRPAHEDTAILRVRTWKELEGFEYKTITIATSSGLEYARFLDEGNFGLSINLCSSRGIYLGAHKVYYIEKTTETDTLVPAEPILPSTTDFRFKRDWGILVLDYSSISEAPKSLAVFFRLSSEVPWCKGSIFLPEADFDGTVEDQRQNSLLRLYYDCSGELSDRWSGKFTNSVGGGTCAVKIAIKRAPDRILPTSELIQMLSLSVSMDMEEPFDSAISQTELSM